MQQIQFKKKKVRTFNTQFVKVRMTNKQIFEEGNQACMIITIIYSLTDLIMYDVLCDASLQPQLTFIINHQQLNFDLFLKIHL